MIQYPLKLTLNHTLTMALIGAVVLLLATALQDHRQGIITAEAAKGCATDRELVDLIKTFPLPPLAGEGDRQ
jgi:hypothetical protein